MWRKSGLFSQLNNWRCLDALFSLWFTLIITRTAQAKNYAFFLSIFIRLNESCREETINSIEKCIRASKRWKTILPFNWWRCEDVPVDVLVRDSSWQFIFAMASMLQTLSSCTLRILCSKDEQTSLHCWIFGANKVLSNDRMSRSNKTVAELFVDLVILFLW